MKWVMWCLLWCGLPMTAWAAVEPGKDPCAIGDVGLYHKQLLGDAPFVFDDRVRLLAPHCRRRPPGAAGNRCPGLHRRRRAGAGLGRTEPVAENRRLPTGGRVLPWLSIRIRIEQATPLRAAVQTRDGLGTSARR